LYLPDARVVFEIAVAKFEPEEAKAVWERWARHQYQFGTLEENLRLDKRLAEAFPIGKLSSILLAEES
jgi:cleavage stimulation factor subunit 3